MREKDWALNILEETQVLEKEKIHRAGRGVIVSYVKPQSHLIITCIAVSLLSGLPICIYPSPGSYLTQCSRAASSVRLLQDLAWRDYRCLQDSE